MPEQPPALSATPVRPHGGGSLRLLAVVVAVVAIWLTVYGAWISPASPGAQDLVELGTLLLILLFVGSALFGRRLTTGEVVRSVVGWLVVALVIGGAYSHRTELAMVGGRILAGFTPGVPLAGRLAGEEDAESVVVMRSRNGLFAVRARVDDVPLTLLVDPGASFVTLTLADAAGVGVDPASLNFTVPIRTANGLIRAAPITLDRLVVGTIERQHLAALVAPPDSLTESLLGMTFLETLGSYAISGDRMVLSN
jgi:aspartyl protease family protein